MTWLEFKTKVEAAGAQDDTPIAAIDFTDVWDIAIEFTKDGKLIVLGD